MKISLDIKTTTGSYNEYENIIKPSITTGDNSTVNYYLVIVNASEGEKK